MPILATTTYKVLLKILAEKYEDEWIEVNKLLEHFEKNRIGIYPITHLNGTRHSPQLWKDIALLTDYGLIEFDEKRKRIKIGGFGSFLSEMFYLHPNLEEKLRKYKV